MQKKIMVLLGLLLILVSSLSCGRETETKEYKPVIYLYPEETQRLSVRLDYKGELTHIYPSFSENNVWNVTAHPDGTLEGEDGKSYYALFWEGQKPGGYKIDRGFCVRGKDTASFLEDKLAKLGLNDREINEFIIYWLPQMENNPFNIIQFQDQAYTQDANLTVLPKEDTMIRVFMTWYASKTPIQIAEQELITPVREGFTVVEWGGAKVK